MIFRRKLLAVFALTVLVSVVAVAWSISSLTRRAFEKANEERHGIQSVMAMARNAKRSRALNFCVSDFNCPQAARMSRPRGVRTGLA